MADNLCNDTVRNEFGKRVKCATVLQPGYSCRRAKLHVTKYRTGFCGMGCHEGTRPVNVLETALPTCRDWLTCGCECHDKLSEMFVMTEQIRTLVDSSGYVPERLTMIMPTWSERAEARATSSSSDPAMAPVRLESPDPDRIPATLARTYAATPTGRSGRGQLESQVKHICDDFVLMGVGQCTPKYVSEMIATVFEQAPPSVGAIDAVWVRWVKIGFAVVEKKPTRFTGYTADGITVGLDGLKLKARH